MSTSNFNDRPRLPSEEVSRSSDNEEESAPSDQESPIQETMDGSDPVENKEASSSNSEVDEEEGVDSSDHGGDEDSHVNLDAELDSGVEDVEDVGDDRDLEESEESRLAEENRRRKRDGLRPVGTSASSMIRRRDAALEEQRKADELREFKRKNNIKGMLPKHHRIRKERKLT